MSTLGKRLVKAAKDARSNISFDFENKIDEYCRSERQWPRHLRLLKAEAQRDASKTPDDRKFWVAVLKRMKD